MNYQARRFLFALCLLLVLLMAGSWMTARYVAGVRNANATAAVGDLIIAYMQAHQGRWPQSWDELASAYRARGGTDADSAMAGYRRRVTVDFSADPRRLAAAPREPGRPPFHVVQARSTPAWTWEGHEPNQMIWQYLQRPATRP